MQQFANISAFENLQSQAHRAMNLSTVGVFNDDDIFNKERKYAAPSWDELKAAYSPRNVGQSLALTVGHLCKFVFSE